MLAILPALALVQPYNLRGEDINVTIGPHPGGFPHHVENVTYDCRSEIELPTEIINEAATVLKEAMKLQDRIVP